MEKSMVQAHFTGLICLQRIQKLTNLFSIMRESGGEGCQMDKEFIKNLEEIYTWASSKMDSSMERAQSGSAMEIFTKESL